MQTANQPASQPAIQPLRFHFSTDLSTLASAVERRTALKLLLASRLQAVEQKVILLPLHKEKAMKAMKAMKATKSMKAKKAMKAMKPKKAMKAKKVERAIKAIKRSVAVLEQLA